MKIKADLANHYCNLLCEDLYWFGKKCSGAGNIPEKTGSGLFCPGDWKEEEK